MEIEAEDAGSQVSGGREMVGEMEGKNGKNKMETKTWLPCWIHWVDYVDEDKGHGRSTPGSPPHPFSTPRTRKERGGQKRNEPSRGVTLAGQKS